MQKSSIWKRVGGWLRGSHTSSEDHDADHLKPDVVVDSNSVPNDDSTAIFARPNRKEQQLAAMEENFNRLVTALESLNDNVRQQCQQNSELNSRLQALPELSKILPVSLQSQQEMVKTMTENVKDQSLRHQQLVEIVKTLPDLTRTQVDRLSDITRHVESSVDTQVRMAESFNRLDNSSQGILNSTQAQATSLANMGQMLEQSQKQFQDVVRQQSRRFAWLMGILVAASLVAVAALVILLLTVKSGT